MAVVSDLVVTGVLPGASFDAGGRWGSALDGRVGHRSTAPTPQLVEGDVGA